MTVGSKPSITAAVEQAAKQAGLIVTSATETTGFGDAPTASFELALASDPARKLNLELSENFAFSSAELLPEITRHLAESAQRLRNPRPDAYVTVEGLPISFSDFKWPFHTSTSGADTFLVHGSIHLADGTDSPLHAKLAASMTLTFAEIVAAPEQPYAETFIYNAIRKTLDQGQLELVKSGNRQPVPVTTRYYSRWQKKFLFTESNADLRTAYTARKLYWLSGVNGSSAPVWVSDPRDAQYLNATPEDLIEAALVLEAQGLAKGWDKGMWSATDKLMEQKAVYEAALHAALDFTKPTFNEDMRHGHTNM
jgi:hypothetical protein